MILVTIFDTSANLFGVKYMYIYLFPYFFTILSLFSRCCKSVSFKN